MNARVILSNNNNTFEIKREFFSIIEEILFETFELAKKNFTQSSQRKK